MSETETTIMKMFTTPMLETEDVDLRGRRDELRAC